MIWLTEVAPGPGREGRQFVQRLQAANEEANPGLARLALKLATGAGKTTVMAMLIAWQTINAVRHPGSRRFTRGFLVATPGLTIRDRLRVLQPNDPDSYYQSRELVPRDMLGDLNRANIVITNYHAFMPRETQDISRGGRALLQGRGPELRTLESEGQMLQRVMPGLMGMKNIMAFNDEAHHCYREKPDEESDEGRLKGDDRKEAEKNKEAARVWISGLEAVHRKLGLSRVIDLSATPFFLRGSGYAEGTRRSAPTSRTTLWGSMSPTGTAPRHAPTSPTSSCSSTTATATATTTCSTSWSKSRATGAKTPRKRKPPWKPTGYRASTAPAPTAAGPSRSSPTGIPYRKIFRVRSGRASEWIDYTYRR